MILREHKFAVFHQVHLVLEIEIRYSPLLHWPLQLVLSLDSCLYMTLLRILWSIRDEMMKCVQTDTAKAIKLPGWAGYRDIQEILKTMATYTVE